jgi:hypothetical protein
MTVLAIDPFYIALVTALIFWGIIIWKLRAYIWALRQPIFFFLGVAAAVVVFCMYAYQPLTPEQAKAKRQAEIARQQKFLPGEWWKLRQSLSEQSYFEAKLQTMEAFARTYPVDEVEGLPGPGFNKLLKFLHSDDNEQTWKNIYRARDALGEYVIPFSEPEGD